MRARCPGRDCLVHCFPDAFLVFFTLWTRLCVRLLSYHLTSGVVTMFGPDLSIVDWNTRGLNDQGRKDTVHTFLADTRCHIVASKRPSSTTSINKRLLISAVLVFAPSLTVRPSAPRAASSYSGTRIMWRSPTFTSALT